MKRSIFTSLAAAAVFSFGAVAAFAGDTPATVEFATKSLGAEEFTAIKKLVKYPQAALQRESEGKFDLLAYIDGNGRLIAVNFQVANPDNAAAMKELIIAATNAVEKYRFSSDYNGSVIRIPFSFKLLR